MSVSQARGHKEGAGRPGRSCHPPRAGQPRARAAPPASREYRWCDHHQEGQTQHMPSAAAGRREPALRGCRAEAALRPRQHHSGLFFPDGEGRVLMNSSETQGRPGPSASRLPSAPLPPPHSQGLLAAGPGRCISSHRSCVQSPGSTHLGLRGQIADANISGHLGF